MTTAVLSLAYAYHLTAQGVVPDTLHLLVVYALLQCVKMIGAWGCSRHVPNSAAWEQAAATATFVETKSQPPDDSSSSSPRSASKSSAGRFSGTPLPPLLERSQSPDAALGQELNELNLADIRGK